MSVCLSKSNLDVLLMSMCGVLEARVMNELFKRLTNDDDQRRRIDDNLKLAY